MQWVAPRCRRIAVDGTNTGRNPVATVAIGKAGAKNAAYLASQILATSDDSLFERVRADREKNKDKGDFPKSGVTRNTKWQLVRSNKRLPS